MGLSGSHEETSAEPPHGYPPIPTKTKSDERIGPVPTKPLSVSSSSSAQTEKILGKPYIDINRFYDMKKELGRGQFGITYLCEERATGREFACKSISKRELVSDNDIEDVKREIMISQHLSGQPNIVEFKGAYEDRSNFYLVMELCTGGELLDRITAKSSYSEKQAAKIFQQIVNTGHDEDAPIKAIDFGLSVFIEEEKVYTDPVGTTFYMAPEVDGVILYILLSGVPPCRAGIFEEILKDDIDFETQPWPRISAGAKNVIVKMLTMDPRKRISAAEALEDPWLKEGGEASDVPLANAVLSRMKKLRTMDKLEELALRVIAENLREEEIKGLREMFNNMDTDRSGTITFEELKTGLLKLRSRLPEQEIKALMEAVKISHALSHRDHSPACPEKEENMFKAFQFFDKDGTGLVFPNSISMLSYELDYKNIGRPKNYSGVCGNLTF
ncbi:Non-specific serine/threonine protein kinase [Bertholletia excelsa]